jgi:putative ABC transport system permease protein
MGIVGCVGLSSTMSTNVLERTREFGIMHALGARTSTIRRLVVTEGIFIGVVSAMVAAIPMILLTAFVGRWIGNQFLNGPLPFRISMPGAMIWLVIVVVGATLATLAPANRASQLTVREALMYL